MSTPFVWEGVACVAAGTGYTGEDGVECAVPADAADGLWTALLATGVQPAGLGARDTLRLEAGLPLHGHELGPGITPLQAGLGWVVGWDKTAFRGRQALSEERRARRGPRTWSGLATAGRQPPREGSVLTEGRAPGAVVTSGNFSPMLEHGIALAFVDSPSTASRRPTVDIDQRGRALPATVVATPFVRPGQWASAAEPDRRSHGPGPRSTRTRHPSTEERPVGTYIPHTDEEVESMLAFLGLASVDDLFDVVPEALRLQRGLELADGAGEPDVLAAMEGFADRNRARSDRLVCFAGGGAYDHEIPVGDPCPGRTLRVRDLLHPVPARSGPGRPAGRLRVPDHGGPAGRAPGGQRLPLRRRQCRGRGRQPRGGRVGPADGVGVGRHPSPLAPDAGHLRRRAPATGCGRSRWTTA